MQAYNAALKVLVPGADDALKPKILINMGITQEAEGLLMAACDYYRWAGLPRAAPGRWFCTTVDNVLGVVVRHGMVGQCRRQQCP